MKKSSIVMIGGGFAGINAAKKLCKAKDRNGQKFQITIVDRRNHHLFQPLLYQVATAGLSPADIASPIRHIFENDSNVEVVWDEIVGVDGDLNLARGKTGVYPFDYLVMACGANHSYFGRDEWEAFAPGLKTVEQATEIRRRILTAFEEAEKAPLETRDPWTTFVVVGAGPTGVEMAGAISELSHHTVSRDYRHFDPSKSRILLIEAGQRVLAAFDPSLSDRAKRDLTDLGVEVRLGTRVENITADGVQLTGEFIAAKTVVWAAGVAPSILGKTLKVDLDPAGRVIVEPTLNLKKYPNIFVLGDQAHFKGKDGKPLPGLAPVAIQQGQFVAKNIVRAIRGETLQSFEYWDKGSMATIGRKRAVMESSGLKFTGLFAWLGWLVIHIYYLIGFRNRVFVFLQWIWSYATFSRGARLIVDKDWRLKK